MIAERSYRQSRRRLGSLRPLHRLNTPQSADWDTLRGKFSRSALAALLALPRGPTGVGWRIWITLGGASGKRSGIRKREIGNRKSARGPDANHAPDQAARRVGQGVGRGGATARSRRGDRPAAG